MSQAAFVKAWAEWYNVSFHLRKPTIKDHQEVGDRSRSIQTSARKWRRSESLALLKELKLCSNNTENNRGYIATAHHEDDQVETLLHKLTRGVHISNIYGMQGMEGNFVKPLLTVSKERLISYMKLHNYDWREDSSNAIRKYKRNKIRLDLIPLLHELTNGGEHKSSNALKNRLKDMIEQSSEVRELLDMQVDIFLQQYGQYVWCKGETFLHESPNYNGNKIHTESIENILLELELSQSRFYDLSSIVQKEVLHHLVKHGSGGRTEGSEEISMKYDTIKRLQTFIIEKNKAKDKSKITMPLGNSLFAVHIGDTLRIIENKGKGYPVAQSMYRNAYNGRDTREEEKVIFDMDNDTNTKVLITNQFPSLLKISKSTDISSIDRWSDDQGARKKVAYSVRLKFPPTRDIDGTSNNNNNCKYNLILRFAMTGDKFLPPWKSNEIKVFQFLRGQNVKLEDRQNIPVLISQVTRQIISVGKFISKDYYIADNEEGGEYPWNSEQHDQILALRITTQERLH